jgi:hypothetical protein
MSGSLCLEISVSRISPARLKRLPAGYVAPVFEYSVVNEPVSPEVYTGKVVMLARQTDKPLDFNAKLFSNAVTVNRPIG